MNRRNVVPLCPKRYSGEEARRLTDAEQARLDRLFEDIRTGAVPLESLVVPPPHGVLAVVED